MTEGRRMGPIYYVRYGLMRRVGRYRADSGHYRAGDRVVIRSRRGTELGVVLAPETATAAVEPIGAAIVGPAGPEDFDRARRAELDRPGRLAACERLLGDGLWPIELIDVEPMLDDDRTVLHYLGPHRLDDSGLRALFRDTCGLDVVLEPAGLDTPAETAEVEDAACGSGGCGTGGGCGSGGGCGPKAEGQPGGCSGCAVKDLVGGRSAVAARA